MTIFMTDGKVNFVDESNCLVGYDMRQDCCEHAGWHIADTPTFDLIETDEPKEPVDYAGWAFDQWYMMRITGGEVDEGGMVVFKLYRKTKGGEPAESKYLHIYNCQNGYYGHGFQVAFPDKPKIEGIL